MDFSQKYQLGKVRMTSPEAYRVRLGRFCPDDKPFRVRPRR